MNFDDYAEQQRMETAWQDYRRERRDYKRAHRAAQVARAKLWLARQCFRAADWLDRFKKERAQ